MVSQVHLLSKILEGIDNSNLKLTVRVTEEATSDHSSRSFLLPSPDFHSSNQLCRKLTPQMLLILHDLLHTLDPGILIRESRIYFRWPASLQGEKWTVEVTSFFHVLHLYQWPARFLSHWKYSVL
jgi:hypothetical protein